MIISFTGCATHSTPIYVASWSEFKCICGPNNELRNVGAHKCTALMNKAKVGVSQSLFGMRHALYFYEVSWSEFKCIFGPNSEFHNDGVSEFTPFGNKDSGRC